MERNYNWPTLDKIIGDSRQQGASWVNGAGNVFFDCFTDVGASPIPNAMMDEWILDARSYGVYYRRPHAYHDILRDEEYPRLIGKHLGLGDDARVFYSSSGTESIEAALKLVRRATGRGYVLGIVGDFHGRTLGALPLHYDISADRSHPVYHFDGFGALTPKTFAVNEDNCNLVPIDDVAAFVISPIQGNNTLEDTPAWVWEYAALVRKNGGLIVFDEVQTGFGRGGGIVSVIESDEWAVRASYVARKANSSAIFDVMMRPDVWCFAKACGAGWPMGLTVASHQLVVETMTKGSHFNTMSGSPMGCYLSTRLIEWLEDSLLDDMLCRAQRLAEFPRIFRRGYMMGIETDDPYGLCHRAKEKGLLLLTARSNKPVRLSPPFYLRPDEERLLDYLLERLLNGEVEREKSGCSISLKV